MKKTILNLWQGNGTLSMIINSHTNYNLSSEIIYHTEILKSSICDYNNAYILVRGNTTIMGHQVTLVARKNCSPFTKCI